jgi:hypothetical protein
MCCMPGRYTNIYSYLAWNTWNGAVSGLKGWPWIVSCQHRVSTPASCLGVSTASCLGVSTASCLGVSTASCLGVSTASCLGVLPSWHCLFTLICLLQYRQKIFLSVLPPYPKSFSLAIRIASRWATSVLLYAKSCPCGCGCSYAWQLLICSSNDVQYLC